MQPSAPRTRSGLTLSNILTPAEAESLRIQAAVVAAGLSLQPEFRNAQMDVLIATAFTRLVKCAELGLKPHLAASAMYEVHGRPAMPTAMIQSIAEASGVVDWTSEEGIDGTVTHGGREHPNHYAEVSMWLVAKPQRKHTERWDLRRGIESGYALDKGGVKSTWLANGSLLPYNRAFSHALRRVAPGVTLGVYSIEEMGYQEEDLRGRNYEDPEAPIGAEKADGLVAALRVVPDAAGALDALKAFKAEMWGSPDYKLAAVPMRDLPALEQWIAGTVATFGKRIGQKRAERARGLALSALQNAGVPDPYKIIREYEEQCGVTHLADMTEDQERGLAELVKSMMLPEEEPEFVGEVVPEPAPRAPAFDRDGRPLDHAPATAPTLFPQGEMTPVSQWQAICGAEGLDAEKLLKLTFSEQRFPESPDEMGRLIRTTEAALAATATEVR